MSFWPQGLLPRLLAVLFASLVVMHLGSVALYHSGLENELDITNEQRLAERIASVRRAIANVPPAQREDLAHSLAGESVEIHWSDTREGITAPLSSAHAILESSIYQTIPDLRGQGVEIYDGSALPGHATASRYTLIRVPLPDQSAVSVALTPAAPSTWSVNHILFSTTLMVLGVMAVAALSLRSLTRSLRSLAAFADHSMPGDTFATVTRREPREVRVLGDALNRMQVRLKGLLDERTQTLAAISHDLKSPLARMRLRVEDIPNPDMATAIRADMAEMEAMLDSTLSFLRGEQDGEEKRLVELGALLETICGDMSDSGADVHLSRASNVVVFGRRLALKRAFANIVENALKYGARARVTLGVSHGAAEVRVEDDGPGIPIDKVQDVFKPFYRIEPSRNRETGGVGLGLTVAKTVLQLHGGDIALSNMEPGLRVTVMLPLNVAAEMI